MQYKNVLFDWDGCLAKTLDIWFYSTKDLLAKNNIYPNDNQIIGGFGDWEFAKKLGIQDNDAFNKNLISIANEKLKNVELYNGAKDAVSKLKENGIKLALVTTSVKTSVMPAITKYNMAGYFDAILTAEDVIKHKPDPEVLLKAMHLLGAKKEDTLIIGDGPKDILAGKSVGISTVSYYPRDNERYYSKNDINSFAADFVISELSDLLDIIIK